MREKVINKQLLLNKITARQEEEINELFVHMMFALYGRADETILDCSESEESTDEIQADIGESKQHSQSD